MLKLILAGLIPVAIVWAAYFWRDALDEALPWLKGWRTVIINAGSAGLILGADLVGFLAGFGWDAVLSAQNAAMMTLSLSILNIVLRFTTNTPVGEKDA